MEVQHLEETSAQRSAAPEPTDLRLTLGKVEDLAAASAAQAVDIRAAQARLATLDASRAEERQVATTEAFSILVIQVPLL